MPESFACLTTSVNSTKLQVSTNSLFMALGFNAGDSISPMGGSWAVSPTKISWQLSPL